MSDFRNDHTDLDAFLSASRRNAPQPSDEILARIEADALAEQASFLKASQPDTAPSGFRSLLPAFGGWPGMAGLAASVVIGIGIGFWQPVTFNLGAEQAEADELSEPLFFSFEDALAEG